MKNFRSLFLFYKRDLDFLFSKKIFAYKKNAFFLASSPAVNEFGRLFIVLPRKVGKANKRNLIRRRLKYIFFTQKLFLHKFDTVVMCKKGAAEYSYSDLKEKLLSHYFQKIIIPRD